MDKIVFSLLIAVNEMLTSHSTVEPRSTDTHLYEQFRLSQQKAHIFSLYTDTG